MCRFLHVDNTHNENTDNIYIFLQTDIVINHYQYTPGNTSLKYITIFIFLTKFQINLSQPIRKLAFISGGKRLILTHSHTITPFDAPRKQAF